MFRKLYPYVIMVFVVFSMGYLLHFSDVDAGKKKIFTCNCGRTCECNFEADKFGKCVCGENLFPSDRRPAETSKYICGCGEECKCGSISDKDGNCVCGKPMKEA
jgi:hypothetical protein